MMLNWINLVCSLQAFSPTNLLLKNEQESDFQVTDNLPVLVPSRSARGECLRLRTKIFLNVKQVNLLCATSWTSCFCVCVSVCACVRACVRVCVFRRVLILSALKYDLFFAQFISSRSFLVHFIMLSTYCVSVLLFFNKFTRYLILIFMLIRSVVHLRVCCRQWEYGKDKTNTQSLTTLTTAARFPHACFNALCFTAVWSFEGYSGREK